jgi:cyclohexa-1,5-dienecarbonyl-CoA hydratase
MQEGIRVSIDGPVARITLNRPPLNVLTTAMLRDLAEAFDTAAADAEVRIVRLDAEGKVFCAGVDVADHAGEALAPMMDALVAFVDAVERAPMPTVSVVHGAALGGGCEVMLATVGERRALAMLLTGAAVRAAEAEGMGLVNQVFPSEGFDDAVDEWFERMLSLSGASLRHAKRAVLVARDKPVSEAHRDLVRSYLNELMKTEDAQEGIRSFLEKRPPVWKHR